MKSDLDGRIDAEAARATSLAMMVADSPSARLAMENSDRQALLTEFRPVFKLLRQLGAIDQFQFHVPPATSLVRLHQPGKYGDDLSALRPTVVDANRNGEVVSGIESGVAGLGIRRRGACSKDGRHLGTVEFGAALGDPLLKSFTKATVLFAAMTCPTPGLSKPIGSTLPVRIADEIQKLAQHRPGPPVLGGR